MTRRRRPARRGFNLIELMIVVGIIGAFAAMAIAVMPRLSMDMRISRSANTFNGLVREARGRAMANRAWTRLCLTGDNLYLEEKNVTFGAMSHGGGACGTWTVVRLHPIKSYEFQNVDFPAVAGIEFSPRGTLNAGDGLYQFKSTSRPDAVRHTVVVNKTGLSEKQ